MKRLIAFVLALLFLFTAAAAEEGTEEQQPIPDKLTVGNPTPMRGEFFTSFWGNSTSDLDVRDLLHGYNLIFWDSDEGLFREDPSVVSGVVVTENEAGDRSYTILLQNDLKYSDGTAINAWDYAFSFLFSISPEIAEIGGTPRRIEQFAGYDEYIAGRSKALSGVRVLADDTLFITIRHEYLPFFYEMGLLSCNPYPISVIAPGVAVRDDGEGVYLANADGTVQEPAYTAELLRKTIMDPENGYLSHPSVVSGPYTLTSWDGEVAEFAINPFYKGNKDGVLPSIPTLYYMQSSNETQIEDLISGKFDLLNKVTREDNITDGIARANTEGNFRFTNYPRSGLSYISFACEKSTVSSEAVRQAIAWCLNREQLVSDYTGNFGLLVDGYFGIGQWMYGVAAGTVAPPIDPPEDENDAEANKEYLGAMAAYEALTLDNLTRYTVDTETAARLLDQDGWTINGDGLREKDGVVLDLKMIYPAGNNISEYLEENFLKNLEQVGIRLTAEEVPMNELLSRWYQQKERDEDMIYLASNFDLLFDPSVYFNENGEWAFTSFTDEKLYEEAVGMRMTEPGDVLTYLQHWIAFQERFNQTLPMIPLYSNVYFDFYTGYLRNYDIDQNVTWGQAIVSAYLSEEEPEEEEAEEATEENEAVF